MSHDDNIIPQLLKRAREGDEASLTELIDRLTTSLRGSTVAEAGSSAFHADALWAQAKESARRQFASFRGARREDAEAWLLDIVQQPKPQEDTFATRVIAPAARPTAQPRDSARSAPPPSDSGPIVPPHAAAPQVATPRAATSPPETRNERGASETRDTPRGSTQMDLGVSAQGLPSETDGGRSYDTMARVSSSASAPRTNRMFGEYEILGTIARGGMGIVYKARQRKLNRIVAVKMILAGQFADQSDVDRFYVEAEAAANLRHPNIVGIYEVGECEGQHYFSMDYIQGQSLADLVRQNPLAPRHAAEQVKVISEAMHYAHQQGILHRDLKPSNVLVDRHDSPMITDFGLAKRTEGQSQLTMSGTIVGTPAYMPPEQASGKIEQISVRSDVYSLGAILYELLTCRPPFVAANPFETIKLVLESEPVSPRALNPNIPVDLETICLKCLQKEPGRRYASALELVDELKRYLAGEPILARPVSYTERCWRWCRRNPRLAIVGSIAAASLLFVATVFPILYAITRVARQNESEAHRQTELALAKAQASIHHMRRAIDELYRIVAEEDLLNEPGFKPIRQKILSQARDLYRQALERLGQDSAIQQDMAVSLFSLGRILRELEEPQEALEPLYKARDIQEELLTARPDDVTRIHQLGNTINLIGQVLENQRELTKALAVYERAIQLRMELVQLEPSNGEFRRQLINSQMNSGLIHKKIFDQGHQELHYQLALERLRQSQASRGDLLKEAPEEALLHLDAARGAYNLASLTSVPVDKLRREILDLQDEMAARPKESSPTELQERIKKLTSQVQPWESETVALLKSAFAELEILHSETAVKLSGFRRIDRFQIKQLQAYCLLLDAYVTEDDDLASKSVQEAKQITEELVRENQESHEFLGALGGVYMLIGDMHFKRLEDQETVQAYERAIALFQDLVKRFPSAARYESQLKAAQNRLVEITAEIGESSKSGAAKPTEATPAAPL